MSVPINAHASVQEQGHNKVSLGTATLRQRTTQASGRTLSQANDHDHVADPSEKDKFSQDTSAQSPPPSFVPETFYNRHKWLRMMWSNKIVTVATLIGLGISIASFVGQVEGNAKTTQGLWLAVDANRIAQEPDVTAEGIYQLKMHKWCARNPVGTSSKYS
jgi:hypothetical protein